MNLCHKILDNSLFVILQYEVAIFVVTSGETASAAIMAYQTEKMEPSRIDVYHVDQIRCWGIVFPLRLCSDRRVQPSQRAAGRIRRAFSVPCSASERTAGRTRRVPKNSRASEGCA